MLQVAAEAVNRLQPVVEMVFVILSVFVATLKNIHLTNICLLLSGTSSERSGGSGVYRPPRGRGRSGYSSWDSENERRPAWADTPVEKDQPKGRFRGGRFRADSDSEGSASEPEHEDEAFSDYDETDSDGEETPGWMYKDPQGIIRGIS